MTQQDNYYFYNVLRKTIVQFLDMFNDLMIARFDKDGNINKYVKVPIKFAPKTKQWYLSERRNEDGTIDRNRYLPIIGVNLNNVELDLERLSNTQVPMYVTHDVDDIKNLLNPTPYNIHFNLKIAAEYIVDVIQIIEQVLPWFTPQKFLRITVPELGLDSTDNNINDYLEQKVVFNGSSIQFPEELGETDYRILMWELNFVVHGHMFQPIYDSPLIKKIVQKYYMTEDSWDQRLSDSVGISGVGPQALEGLTIATSDTKYDEDLNILYKYEHFL